MPRIIDYPIVLEQMREAGFKSLYYNSGAFGFADPEGTATVGWIGPEDPTIRDSARALARCVPPPYEANLTRLFSHAWREHLPGRVWIMPMSHWAYELDYGGRDWMPALIENVELDPGLLQGRNTAAALEFASQDVHHLESFVQRLLEMLQGSDFTLAFPGHATLCLLHHHKQLWWTSRQSSLIEALKAMAG